MCGRYRLTTKLDTVADLIDTKPLDYGEPVRWPLQPLMLANGEPLRPRYNVAPTDQMPVIFEEDGFRQIRAMRWGLVPGWAARRGVSPPLMINARVETLHEKPAFRALVEHHRCLVPTDGYYEWQTAGADDNGDAQDATSKGGKKRRAKTPHLFHYDDDRLFFFGGLWTRAVTGPQGNLSGPDAVVESFTVITTEAAPALRFCHDRQPIILGGHQAREWLAADHPPAHYRWDESPADFGHMVVSSRVGSVRFLTPDPIEADAATTTSTTTSTTTATKRRTRSKKAQGDPTSEGTGGGQQGSLF